MTVSRTLSLALFFVAACGGGGGGGHTKNTAVENSCLEVCTATKTACASFDEPTCASTCPSYAVLIDAGSSCESAYLAYQACLESTTYTCVGNYAFPAGTDCDALNTACDSACDTPCL